MKRIKLLLEFIKLKHRGYKMKRIKLLLEFIKLKHRGYNKEERYSVYAIKGLINFEQYEKFIDKKVMKGVE